MIASVILADLPLDLDTHQDGFFACATIAAAISLRQTQKDRPKTITPKHGCSLRLNLQTDFKGIIGAVRTVGLTVQLGINSP